MFIVDSSFVVYDWIVTAHKSISLTQLTKVIMCPIPFPPNNIVPINNFDHAPITFSMDPNHMHL